MLRVGLRAMGGTDWVAGVQYLHSLLYGNSLLPEDERTAMRVYLDYASNRRSDYHEVGRFSSGVDVTDFSPASSWRPYRVLRRMVGVVMRERRCPALPRLDLVRLLQQNRTDVFFAGNVIERNVGIPQISWIPDFQHIHRPDFFPVEERQRRDRHFARIMAKADRVIVSNQCSYADAVKLYPENRHKLAVLPFTMYLGEAWREGDAQRVVRKYDLPKKFLLFPSQFWKHKNHITVFRAIQQLHERGIDDAVLVCTGFKYDSRFPDHVIHLQEFLVNRGLAPAIRILGLLPRADQVQLMRAAAAIVQPSLFEGWSALLEEAQSLGKTIFASDVPMHREQFAKGVHLFPPTSVPELVDLLVRHWPDLTPGPDAVLEAAAEAQYQVRIREFGRQFNSLCRSAGEPASINS